MEVHPTALPDVKLICPNIFRDDRGYFCEIYNTEAYRAAGITAEFVQDNESLSMRGVIRGLHWQEGIYAQAKLVRVIRGAVWDVAVDIRKGSPTFGKHIAVELSSENKYQLFVPRGFAHGFVVLTESATFAYKCDNTYMPSHERGIAFNDPALAIDWKVNLSEYLLSAKDMKNPCLADAEVFDYTTREYLQ